jgi:hypothetical protein
VPRVVAVVVLVVVAVAVAVAVVAAVVTAVAVATVAVAVVMGTRVRRPVGVQQAAADDTIPWQGLSRAGIV